MKNETRPMTRRHPWRQQQTTLHSAKNNPPTFMSVTSRAFLSSLSLVPFDLFALSSTRKLRSSKRIYNRLLFLLKKQRSKERRRHFLDGISYPENGHGVPRTFGSSDNSILRANSTIKTQFFYAF